MKTRTLVGTASWTDKPLIESGSFYPKGTNSAEARLRYYASQFQLVEVDSTYYALPSLRNAQLWVDRTPGDFTFNVKAYGLFTTHGIRPQTLPVDLRESLPRALLDKRSVYLRDVPPEVTEEAWRRFEEALLPLDSAGKLGVVVFQFPPWFTPGSRAESHLVYCQRRLPQYRMAVEFRNYQWFEASNLDRTFDFLRDRQMAFICVDEPQGFKSSVPPVAEATAEISVVRFHGRNRDTWERPGGASLDRFDYFYTADEMREWAPRVRKLQDESGQVHLIINTNNHDQGPVNARLLMEVLQEEKLA